MLPLSPAICIHEKQAEDGLSYIVECDYGDTAAQDTWVPVSDDIVHGPANVQVTITGLEPSKKYRMRVIPREEEQNGPPSDPVVFTTSSGMRAALISLLLSPFSHLPIVYLCCFSCLFGLLLLLFCCLSSL